MISKNGREGLAAKQSLPGLGAAPCAWSARIGSRLLHCIAGCHPKVGDSVMTFTAWLRGLIRGSVSTLKKARAAAPRGCGSRFRPSMEVLEDRVVPSATLLTATTTFDYNNDGTVDYTYSTTQSFDHRGNPLSSVTAYDWNGDGAADRIYSITQSFDSHSNLLSSVTAYDWNGDGTADYTSSVTQSFDIQS